MSIIPDFWIDLMHYFIHGLFLIGCVTMEWGLHTVLYVGRRNVDTEFVLYLTIDMAI